ncbi:MAG: glycosyltransferase family 39 protein [Ruminococcus sp.]|nr:glycosyltransferase family 39 protein [Ruminococcus sp.]
MNKVREVVFVHQRARRRLGAAADTAVYGLFGRSFTIVIGAALVGIMSSTKDKCPAILPALVVGAGFLCALGLRELERRIAQRFPLEGDRRRVYKRTVAAAWAVMLLLQLAVVSLGVSQPINDLSYVVTGAKNQVLYGPGHIYDGLPLRHSHYFAVYPNNHMLYMWVYLVYRIEYFLAGCLSDLPLVILNVIGINISYLLACKCAGLIFAPEKAAVCALRGLMFTPLVTYAAVFYTDTSAMLPLTLGAWLYLRSMRSEKGRKIALLAGAGAALGVAYKMKGSAGVFLIAVLIDILLKERTSGDRLRCAGTATAVFAAVCVAVSAAGNALLHITPQEREQYQFPTVHWVMMSADGRGGYEEQDFYYTQSFQGIENKKSADLQRLTSKLERQGPWGFAAHLMQKLSYTWGDCTFMASYYTPSPVLRSVPVLGLSMLCHFTLLFSVLLSLTAPGVGNLRGRSFVFPLALMGLTVFLLIWEARCRYLISFFFLFMLI